MTQPRLNTLPCAIPASVALSAIMAGLIGCAGSSLERGFPGDRVEPDFIEIVTDLGLIPDSTERARTAHKIAGAFQASQQQHVRDSTAYLWYYGDAGEVFVTGDFNAWNPRETPLRRIPFTEFFWTSLSFDTSARVEYKFIVDGRWTLDPANPLTATGGFGPNSELRMPGYREPAEIVPWPGVMRGSIDTLLIQSTTLGRPFWVYVYVPPTLPDKGSFFPSITVADGGDYLTLARMPTVLDNLIGRGQLPPIIGFFLEPRTDIHDARTNTRMFDYMLNGRFVDFITRELRDSLIRRYPVSVDPQETAILGASLGGLLATHTALSHPDVYGLCAAQSPAYWIESDSIFFIASTSPSVPAKVYLDTGTLSDAQQDARRMRDTLASRSTHLRYIEVPEGHNWANWRARLDDLLVFLFGSK